MGSQVSQLLQAVADGDADAMDRLISLVYAELQAMARAHLAREQTGHSLQPTDLVAEAYLRLAGTHSAFENRAHFFGAAGAAMRRVLVDHARARAAGKRGGGVRPVTFEDMQVQSEDPRVDVLALNDALEALEREDARLAAVVQLRYFVGLSIAETAETLGTSPATVKRDWTYARAWIFDHIQSG